MHFALIVEPARFLCRVFVPDLTIRTAATTTAHFMVLLSLVEVVAIIRIDPFGVIKTSAGTVRGTVRWSIRITVFVTVTFLCE